jgi:putative aminopeptidase FrvX
MTRFGLDLELLKTLTQIPGLPGRELRVAEVIRSALPKDWTAWIDPLGNLIARRPGKGPKLLLVAHMDEVGLVVRRITPDGFLQVERLGGMGVRALPGSRLDLWTSKSCLNGVVGVPPAHLDKGEILSMESLFVDIGSSTRQEVEQRGVEIGDGLTWHAVFDRLGEKMVISKALDDRLGCFVLLELAKTEFSSDCDLYLGFVVQEETMLQGALPVVQAVQPEIVIGIDGTLAFDTPDLEGAQSEIRLGCGPALKILDAIRGKMAAFVPDWGLVERIRSTAYEIGVPLQSEVVSGISTAVTPLPYSGGGVRTAALSLPVRYHHSASEVGHMGDAEDLVRLLVAIAVKKD